MSTNPCWSLGQAAASTIWTGQMNTAQQQPYGQLSQHAWYAQQAQQAQQASAFAQFSKQQIERRDWMIDGQAMTFKEFADALFPEDSAERTMFFLKYSK